MRRSAYSQDWAAHTNQLQHAGSCRLPAASQGLFSLRPTIGCYEDGDGLQPYQFTRDTVGESISL